MKKIWVLLMLCISFLANAQFTVKLVVTDIATKKNDDVYLTGTMNNWDPHQSGSLLKIFGPTRKAIVLYDVKEGYYEFKFTRGSFEKVEVTADGQDIPNRTMRISGDTIINLTIEGWKDNYPNKPRPQTATAQVSILDTAFAMPQLNSKRRIWLYLPKGYNAKDKKKKYPVLYMHDGQNLFNENTAPFGEWGVDECLDSMKVKCIVVGIDHAGDRRMNEYNPYDNAKFGKGDGAAYVDFLVNTLKPFIDGKFNTLKDQPNTYIAGSSMGGLISMYATLKYPNVFGGAGIFSPAFWVTEDKLLHEVEQTGKQIFCRYYFYAGAKEGKQYVDDMDKVIKAVENGKGTYKYLRDVNGLGEHKESYWRNRFDDFYKWIMTK
jgi:predicted alpha/beta superfamily hydrolase